MKKLIVVLVLFFSLAVSAQDKKAICEGHYKSGERCIYHAKEGSKFCGVHETKARFDCGAKTKAGGACKTNVKAQGLKCWRHNKS